MEKTIKYTLDELRRGTSVERIKKQLLTKYTEDQINELVTTAQQQLATERQEAAKKRSEDRKKKRLAARQKLVEEDTSVLTEMLLSRFEAKLRLEMPEDELEDFNRILRSKSGAISFREIAAVGIIRKLVKVSPAPKA